MDPLTPQMLETVLHYALGIAVILGGSRIVAAFIHRRDVRQLSHSVDALHGRLDRLESTSEWTADTIERAALAGLIAETPRPPLPTRVRDGSHITPH